MLPPKVAVPTSTSRLERHYPSYTRTFPTHRVTQADSVKPSKATRRPTGREEREGGKGSPNSSPDIASEPEKSRAGRSGSKSMASTPNHGESKPREGKGERAPTTTRPANKRKPQGKKRNYLFFFDAICLSAGHLTWGLLADQRGIEPPPAVCPRHKSAAIPTGPRGHLRKGKRKRGKRKEPRKTEKSRRGRKQEKGTSRHVKDWPGSTSRG